MTDKQLPPLPTLLRTRVVDGVPCISVSEHEYQMREYALQAIAHATQPAEVTDSMIREAFLTNGFTIKDGHSDLKPYVYAAARAILALLPQAVEKRVPMPHRHYSEALADDLIASGDAEPVIAAHSGKEAP